MECPGLHCDGCGSGGGFPWGLAAGLLAAAAVAAFVLSHLVVIAAGAMVVLAVTAGAVRFLYRYVIVGQPLARSAALPAVITVHAVTSPQSQTAIGAALPANDRPGGYVVLAREPGIEVPR